MFRDLRPYPSYGEALPLTSSQLPQHWASTRFGSVAHARSVPGRESLGLLSVYLGRGVIPYAEGGKRVHSPSLDLSLYQEVRPGDLVMNNQQAWRGSVGVSSLHGLVSPAYHVYALTPGLIAAFAGHLFSSYPMVAQYVVASKGVGDIQRQLYVPYLKNLTVPLPPEEEQIAVAEYLGHAHRRIDRAIAAKRTMIALLEEQRRAIISRAVIRGLDPTVPLKDTGIPWLGRIPENWRTCRAKGLFREVDVRSTDGAEVLLSLRVQLGLVPHNDVASQRVPTDALIGYKLVRPGQVVMNRMRAATGLFGVATSEGLVSPDYAVLAPGAQVHPAYFVSVFKTPAAMAEFRRGSTGLGTGASGFMRLYSEEFGRIPLPVPSQAEQGLIAAHISDSTAHIASTVERATREMGLLVEFRTRLTADVVTGQLDVRRIAARLPELGPDELAPGAGDLDDDLEDEVAEFMEDVET